MSKCRADVFVIAAGKENLCATALATAFCVPK